MIQLVNTGTALLVSMLLKLCTVLILCSPRFDQQNPKGAYAHFSTAKVIFKPVSHAWQPRDGLQWRKADQPTEKWRKAGQPVRVLPYVDCAMLSQFYVYYGFCIVGAMFKLYLYN